MSIRNRFQGRQTQFHIELLYGLLFIAGFGYLAFRVDPRVAAFEGGLVVGYLLRIWEKMSIYERILKQAVSEEAEQQVSEEVEERVNDEVEQQVGDEIEQRVSDEVATELEDQVGAEVDERLDEEVQRQVEDEIDDLDEQIDERIDDRIGDVERLEDSDGRSS